MKQTLGFLSIVLALLHTSIEASGVFYREVSESNTNAIIKEVIHELPVINQSFHHCSMKDACNFVIKSTLSGLFTQSKDETEIPQNKTGLRIWKKIIPVVQNCQEYYKAGFKNDGIFTINIPTIGPSKVRCDMTTQPGGWIVFQRRVDATVDFNLNWTHYREGFGDLNGNFWLGLKKIQKLAAPDKGAKLRVDLKHINSPGVRKYAEYSIFEISDEAYKYKLKVGGYSGTAGDALQSANGQYFSTKDSDNDVTGINCAEATHGPWWHESCSYGNLNNKFPSVGSISSDSFMSWYFFSSTYGGIVFSEMKIKV